MCREKSEVGWYDVATNNNATSAIAVPNPFSIWLFCCVAEVSPKVEI